MQAKILRRITIFTLGEKRRDERVERASQRHGGGEGGGSQKPEVLRGGEKACHGGDTNSEERSCYN